MGVYIKNMEMPTSCSVCPMLEGDRMDGLCHAASKWLDDDEHWTWYVYPEGDMDESKPCNCPLVPVPPHGRLIDADVLAKRIKDEGRNQAEYYADRYAPVVMAYGDCYGKAQSAPTIIPASEEDE
jgi:hypothetical protein